MIGKFRPEISQSGHFPFSLFQPWRLPTPDIYNADASHLGTSHPIYVWTHKHLWEIHNQPYAFSGQHFFCYSCMECGNLFRWVMPVLGNVRGKNCLCWEMSGWEYRRGSVWSIGKSLNGKCSIAPWFVSSMYWWVWASYLGLVYFSCNLLML